MSNGPFFTTGSVPRRIRKNRYSDIVDDETYLQLHWTQQLVVKRKYDKPYEKGDPGDFDNRIDNWDDPEQEEIK